MIAQKNTSMPPIPGIAPNTACTTAETILNKNHAQPKMVDCDFAPVSGSGLGGGGGGDVGWFGSTGSGMAYIRKFGDTLSRNLPRVYFDFGFHTSSKTIIVAC